MDCCFLYEISIHGGVVFIWSLQLGMEHFTAHCLFSTGTCSVGSEVSFKCASKGRFTFYLSVWFSASTELYTNVILNLIPRSALPKWSFRHPYIFPSRGQKVDVTSGYSVLVTYEDSHSCSYELWSSILLTLNWYLISKMETGLLSLFVWGNVLQWVSLHSQAGLCFWSTFSVS